MRAVALGIFAAALALIAFAMLRPHPISPRESYANALAAIERGNFSAARNDAMAVIAADPRSPAAHMTLARAYLLLGDGLAAEGELDRAANAGIAEDRIRGARARARLLQGDIDGAVTEAQAAPPDDTLAARTLAWARARQGDRAEAETLFARLLAAHPHDAATLTDLGRSRLDAGDLAGAADGGQDFQPVADYSRVPQHQCDPVFIVIRNHLGIEVIKGGPVVLPLTQHRIPTQSRLGAFENEKLE